MEHDVRSSHQALNRPVEGTGQRIGAAVTPPGVSPAKTIAWRLAALLVGLALGFALIHPVGKAVVIMGVIAFPVIALLAWLARLVAKGFWQGRSRVD